MTYRYEDQNVVEGQYREADSGTYYGGSGGGAGGPGKKKKKRAALLVLAVALVFGLAAGGMYYGLEVVRGGKQVEQVSIGQTSGSDGGIKQVVTTKGSVVSGMTDVSDVVENTMPSIVSVTCSASVSSYGNYYGFDYFYGGNRNGQGQEGTLQQTSAGTGIIAKQNGDKFYILTNYHVISSASVVEVTFNDGNTAQCTVVGYDSDADLAVLSVESGSLSQETLSAIRTAAFGDSGSVRTGEPAIAIGNSLGYGQSVTTGIISAVNRQVALTDTTMELLQTDAAINPGNSGGPLLNGGGEVIGINSVKYASAEVEGMGYAIPISKAIPIVESIINMQDIPENERGYLGITGRDIDANMEKAYGIPQGVYISSVDQDSPAQRAGLTRGVVITKADGRTITSMSTLSNVIKGHKAGDVVEMTIMVANQGEYAEQTVSVTLGAAPQQ